MRVEPRYQVGERGAVHAFPREDAEVARCRDALLRGANFLPHEVGQLHQKYLFRQKQVEIVQRRLGREDVVRVQAEAEVRRIGAADDIPGDGELADRTAPGKAFVGDVDPQRYRQHRELAQVARQRIGIGGGVRRRRRADQKHLRSERMTHLEHRLRDVDLVLVQVARQPLEIAQHLEAGHPQPASAHRPHGVVEPLRVRNDVARRQHDLRETGVANRVELGRKRPRERDRVHAEVADVGQRRDRLYPECAVIGVHRGPART